VRSKTADLEKPEELTWSAPAPGQVDNCGADLETQQIDLGITESLPR